MSLTIQLAFTEWKRAANELFAKSDRTLPDFINGQALAVAIQALRLTKKADRARIEYELGATATNMRVIAKGKRKGKFVKAGTLIKDDSLAERIIAKRFRETGQWIGKGATLKKRAEWLIKRRMSSVAYIKAGWIPAIKILKAVVKQRPVKASGSIEGVRQYGKDKGTAKPATAKPGLIFAQIENEVPGLAPTTSTFAIEGLTAAFSSAAQDMRQELARRLKKDMARNGMK